MKKRYYVRFNTGSQWFEGAKWFERIEDAMIHCSEQGYESIHSISTSDSVRKQHVNDRYCGYNRMLGKHFSNKKEYDAELKRQGLVEVGNEKLELGRPRKETYLDDSAVKEARAMGSNITESQVREINAELKQND